MKRRNTRSKVRRHADLNIRTEEELLERFKQVFPEFSGAKDLDIIDVYNEEYDFSYSCMVIPAWFVGLFIEQRLELEDIRKQLDDGRIYGVSRRQEIAEKKHDLIRGELDKLYEHGEGWKMTYPRIADFFIYRGISSYTKTQTLKLIKEYAPKIKEKYRNNQ